MAGSNAAAFLAAVVAVTGIAVAAGADEFAEALASPSPPGSTVEPSEATSAKEETRFVTVVGPSTVPKQAGGVSEASADSLAGAPAADRPRAQPLCASTRWQREVEQNLAALAAYGDVTVDGRQSADDCTAIRAFQQRFGIAPAHGQADATTADVARRIAVSSTPEHLQRCGAQAGITACVDLSLQTVWVMRDGALMTGPTVVRTGFRGHATPAGTYTINKRSELEWSDPYGVWLPYWQRFVGGIGFHETTTYLHDAARGSHGCVNLLRRDAVTLWNQLKRGAAVRTFGRRPGT